jgi:hypothetical protein
MVEKLNDLLPVILLAFFLWLSGLTVIFYRLLIHYQRLVKGVKRDSLIQILDTVIKDEQLNKKSIIAINEEIGRIDKELLSHIQRLGVIRFNAFSGAAGDGQSFSLALLDKEDNGVILTSLHARERTRVYAKTIKLGKGTVELSDEETKALKLAQKS